MHSLVALVTLVALLLFLVMCVRVGAARVRLGVAAPAGVDEETFEAMHANDPLL